MDIFFSCLGKTLVHYKVGFILADYRPILTNSNF